MDATARSFSSAAAFLERSLSSFGWKLCRTSSFFFRASVSSCVGFLANYQAFSGISRWQMVVVYVLMLLAILLKPEGLFGKKTVKKV